MASIVIGTIQLGATVDYAILMTTRFREELNAGRSTKDAVQTAVEQCSQSILTSGLTFFRGNLQRFTGFPHGTYQQPVPSHQPRRAHQHACDSAGAARAAYPDGASHPENHLPLAQQRKRRRKPYEKVIAENHGRSGKRGTGRHLRPLPVFAEQPTEGRDERRKCVLILNPDGSVSEQIVSDWLHSDTGFDAAADRSTLSGITNLKSDVLPAQDGEKPDPDHRGQRYLLSGAPQRRRLP